MADDAQEQTYRVLFHPDAEWFAMARLNDWGDLGSPNPKHYPVVSRSGLTRKEADEFVATNGRLHPEFYTVQPDPSAGAGA